MAGVGIAAAIGFVFALTFLNNTGADSPEDVQRFVKTQPDESSSFFFSQHEPLADEAPTEEGATMLKQEVPSDPDSSQQEMSMLQESPELRPALSQVIAINGTSGETIMEVKEDSKFTLGGPVFIQAQFTNPNEAGVLDHTLVMTLARDAEADDTLEQAANFRGDIGPDESVNLEFYWNPNAEGEYLLRVFSLTPDDLAGESEPILSIPIQAAA
jgi:hypothetical protein